MTRIFYVTFKPEHAQGERGQTPEAHPAGWVRVVAADIAAAESIARSHYGEKYDDVLTGIGMTLRTRDRGVLPEGELGILRSEYDGAPDESYPGQRADLAAEAEQDARHFGTR